MNAVTTPATSKLAQVAKGRKKCAGPCGKTKSVKEFSGSAKSLDGLMPKCKDCMGQAISAGHARRKARLAREAEIEAERKEKEMALVPMSSPEAAVSTFTDLDVIAGRLKILACHARGMACMDERLDGHANDLELLSFDLTNHMKGTA